MLATRSNALNVLLFVSLAVAPASADVVRIEVQSRSDLVGGQPFGAAGPYEKLSGKIFFAVDPALPANRIVADIDKAPRNAAGRVEFSSDFFLIKPKQIGRGKKELARPAPDAHETDCALLHDLLALWGRARIQPDVAGSERRVPGERKLAMRREYPHTIVRGVIGRTQQERRLAEVGPIGEGRHLRIGERIRSDHDSQWISAQRLRGKDVNLVKRECCQCGRPPFVDGSVSMPDRSNSFERNMRRCNTSAIGILPSEQWHA